jgi:hypothetical protein
VRTDEYIDPPEPLEYLVEQRIDFLGLAHITLPRDDATQRWRARNRCIEIRSGA